MNDTTKQIHERAAEYWSNQTLREIPQVRRWWQSPQIIRHINALLNLTGDSTIHNGFHQQLTQRAAGKKFEKAISVGCGSGDKEMRLLASGLVKHFDLYELSLERINRGKLQAEKLGVADRICFVHADAYEDATSSDYDLIYWNNALHHMLDCDFAIAWSASRLKAGGVFAMDDFVGPSRFQWTDTNIEFASRFRSSLPERFLLHPTNKGQLLSRNVSRPSVENMIKIDPTEAADSSAILPSLKRHFPDAFVQLTGGCIYHTGLNDILANLTSDSDAWIIELALTLDRALMLCGETQYAVCIS